jgi:outer membrane protein assembly factor BamB
MFHVKHGRYFAVLGLLLAVLAIGCGGAASSRGWAPAVQDRDTVLVSSQRGKLDGVDARTGQRKWRFPDDWRIESRSARSLDGIYAAPIVQGDTVYVADYNGYVYRFKPSDARPGQDDENQVEAGVLKIGSAVFGLTLEASSGTLFATARDGGVYAIPLSDFSLFDAGEAAGEIWASPEIDGTNLYIADTDGNLYSRGISRDSESLRQVFSADAALVTAPLISGRTALIGGFDDRLHAVDLSSGRELWNFKAGNWVWSRPAVSGGVVYVADFDGNVNALNLSDGTKVWNEPFKAGGPVRAGLTMAGNVIVVVTEAGEVFGIDSNGDRRWGPVVLGGRVLADPVLAEDSSLLIVPASCIEQRQSDGTDRRVSYFTLVANSATPEPRAVLSDRGC